MHHQNAMSYSNWIRMFFDHTVTDFTLRYHEDDTVERIPADCVAYLTLLFEAPEVLDQYSDAQVNQGFWDLLHRGYYIHSLTEPSVPWLDRQRAIRAIEILFSRLFARKCSNHLSYRDEPGASPLNSVCYMWWDIFPYHGRPKNPDNRELDMELLGVMERILNLDSLACRESALHGLGHWQMYYPEVVHKVIDNFLAVAVDVSPELLVYAKDARRGMVQ